ncbi:hypothetical protein GCM10010492_60530 [Saccharothrix mutabilis subsp. mutabilis]|uniref:Uncharacterized protein n=1 Tax=Saccharothrix mutabilis subsp. mutabilis TaxID=66855 RepID=A0ABN0UJ81_9PSEU
MADHAPDWVIDTRSAVRRASDAKQAHEDLRVISEAARDLSRLLEQLEGLTAAAEVGLGTWWKGIAVPSGLETALETVESEPDRRQIAVVVRELKQFNTRARNSVDSAWSEYVEARAGDAAALRDLVDVLAGSGTFAVAGKLRDVLVELPTLRRQTPDAAAVARLDEVVTLAEEFEESLPKAVKDFVSAAAQGGASVGLLNAEVLSWLHDHGVVGNFKVVAGSPVEVPRG